MKWLWIDTGWGCGAIVVDDNEIIKSAPPIFKRWIGEPVDSIPGILKKEELK